MNYIINAVETVAILCFAPFVIAYGVMRFMCAAVLLVCIQIVDVWTDN